MKRDLKTMPLEELCASAEGSFLEKATSEQIVAVIHQRIAADIRRLRRPPLRLRSGRFEERLRLHPARTQNANRVRFEQPWQRTLGPPPQGRKPMPGHASVEELQKELGACTEEADQVIRQIIARKTRPRTALVPSRLRRRAKLYIKGKRLRIDDPTGRMNAWTTTDGRSYCSYLEGDIRKIRLTNAQINRVLDANGLPIPHFGQQERDLLRLAYRDLPDEEVARLIVSSEIDQLTWRLLQAHIHPPLPAQYTKRELERHKRKLSEQAEALKELLFDDLTDVTWAPRPASRLAHLKQELLDFCREVSIPVEVSPPLDAGCHAPCDRAGTPRSALETFIDENLRGAFEYIYNQRCTISRRAVDGTAYGPFIIFAEAFFAEAGFRTLAGLPFPSTETIARALRPHQRASNGARSGATRRRASIPPN